jgi:predicted unusual protein kinase regulating ubiquinone biosynthesis (AarF/ABC1/UbiB family)
VSDIPRRTAARTAKLASLPLGVAGRAVGGWGRRLAGGDGEEISAQLMAKSAEQLFAVLGELKGGAMKFGQALSVFEAAIPTSTPAPFRESLIKLQTAAPPMPSSDVHRMLAEQFGRGWRARFTEFDETPAAAASIGQVHRGCGTTGARSPSRCSTRAPKRRCAPTCGSCRA